MPGLLDVSRRKFTVFGALFCLCMAGCGGEDRPETVQVSGTVTFNGTPLKGGTITLVRVGGSQKDTPNRPSVSEIKPDGTFELGTFQAGDGVMPGDYQVVSTP